MLNSWPSFLINSLSILYRVLPHLCLIKMKLKLKGGFSWPFSASTLKTITFHDYVNELRQHFLITIVCLREGLMQQSRILLEDGILLILKTLYQKLFLVLYFCHIFPTRDSPGLLIQQLVHGLHPSTNWKIWGGLFLLLILVLFILSLWYHVLLSRKLICRTSIWFLHICLITDVLR